MTRRHYLTGNRGPKWNEGAGILAMRDNGGAIEALVVNGKKGALSFPKGRREKQESALENGLREWREETGLPQEFLSFYDGVVLVDAGFGCHYYLAMWTKQVQPGEPASWAPPCEDPTDNDPIIRAQWLPLGMLLKHSNLSHARKLLLKLGAQVAAVGHPQTPASPA